MSTMFRRGTAALLALSLMHAGMVQAAPPSGASPSFISAEAVVAAADSRAQLNALLDRADVAAALQSRGVAAQAVRERVAALTDTEAAQLLTQIDQSPAGADGVLGTIVFIFVLLLITDILGLTKVFPFTRSVR